ncbi:hypothetical protein AGMMS49579_03700 [Spirochaetia bacterium]|nr:hypothetical protein AGMMS49579_03700 [Spirochaetia bacterium]
MSLNQPKYTVRFNCDNFINTYKNLIKIVSKSNDKTFYINTFFYKDFIYFDIVYKYRLNYQEQINYIYSKFNTLTANPDNIYDEVTDKMSNIYELMIKDYVIDTHTIIIGKEVKCIINFGKIEDNIIKYFNPKTKEYCDIKSILYDKYWYKLCCYDNFGKIVHERHFHLIDWDFNRIISLLPNEEKDEEVPEDQIGISVCKICYENKVNILFFPCKHAVSCINCSECLNCPICKRLITSKLEIFIN